MLANQLHKPTEEDQKALEGIFGAQASRQILSLHQAMLDHPDRKPKKFTSVTSDIMDSKQTRTQAHQTIRRIFESRLETQTTDEGKISLRPSPRRQRPGVGAARGACEPQLRGKMGWDELGGEFTHFTLYKENKDTMDVVAFLASMTKAHSKRFQFCGTKDRRAVTVQRACAYRMRGEAIAALGRRLKSASVGDFSYHPKGVELGDLAGNEFLITLRNAHFPGESGLNFDARLALGHEILSRNVKGLLQEGFINYFGLQRFGTSSAGTEQIGRKLLQGDLKAAIADILSVSDEALAAAQGKDAGANVSAGDKARADAIHTWRATGRAKEAAQKFQRAHTAEANIVRFLGHWDSKTRTCPRAKDYQGALYTLPRNLRLMYVHAYQSLVWNTVAGHRWRLYGSKVVEGDLVIINNPKAKQETLGPQLDDEGEVVVQPAVDDTAVADDMFIRARHLSAEEAASGKYTIFDIVLPLPGFDIAYPTNQIKTVYEEFMASEQGGGLDPHNMRRSWKEISLSGSYRSLISRPGPGMSYEIKSYLGDEEQIMETDLQRLQKKAMAEAGQETVVVEKDENETEQEKSQRKLAVVVKFSLGPGQYATMALRELMGPRGLKTYSPDFGPR